MRDRILLMIRANPTCTAISIAEHVGLTPEGVRYHLDILKKAGRIHHEGPNKGGRWVTDEQD